MKRKGFTLVEIMIVVAIIALLAAIAIPNLLTAKKAANEAAAKASVRSLSTAAEVYATSWNGVYPADTGELTAFISSAPDYCGATAGSDVLVQGYTYNCDLASTGYTLTATGPAGSKTYTATTGGVLSPL